jgi:beta-glucosidase
MHLPLRHLPLAALLLAPLHADEARIDSIIARLSPEEKVAQLAGVRLNELMVDGRLSLERAAELAPHGIGHVSQFASCVALQPAELAATVTELQRFLVSRNAAGVPAIFHEEAITGFAARGATTYPQQIGMASTWRPDLIRANAAATARAMRAIGATQALSPMLDVIDDARWGRSEEGFGEDPYLAAVMGTAFIRGLQGDDDDFRTDVAATAKHFAGYGNSAEDLALFRDEVLPPHEAAVFAARVSSVMPGYHSYRGEPASCSTVLLRQILRGEWKFDGCVVADYGAIGQIHSQYKAAPTALDGAIRALAAGMDVELPSLSAYRELPVALKDGRASKWKPSMPPCAANSASSNASACWTPISPPVPRKPSTSTRPTTRPAPSKPPPSRSSSSKTTASSRSPPLRSLASPSSARMPIRSIRSSATTPIR